MNERRTTQKEAVKMAFTEATHPLTPQELLAAGQRHSPTLGIATVYRAIRALTADQTVIAVALPGESPRYELSEMEHHHHFQCRQCSKVFHLHGCMGDFQKLLPSGFQLDDHDVTLYGKCADCARGAV
jgi:Fur family transcriptional regulator, ferric uptake regulator